MKVQGPQRTAPVTAEKPVERISRPDAKEPAHDDVKVSGAARRLASARAPEVVDQAKVDRLKASIAAGSFQPDSHKIAEAMIKEER